MLTRSFASLSRRSSTSEQASKSVHPRVSGRRVPRRVLVLLDPIAFAQDQGLGDDRDRRKSMLKKIKDDLKRDYYDPKFRGMNVDVRFKEAAAKIDEAHSLGQIMGIIPTVLGELDDSHTFFVPPDRTDKQVS
jgi:hypothetical protein